MINKTLKISYAKIVLALFFLLAGIFFLPLRVITAGEFGLSVVVTVCGNGVIESGEQCDGAALGGTTCVSRGYVSGSLSCSLCNFNTSSCVSASGGGGGGGGGTLPPPPLSTKVILSGKAHPNSSLTVLKDGQVVTSAKAGAGADFKIEVGNLNSGTYTFGIWGEDINGLKSITFNFTVFVQANAITTLSGIFIPPTISTTKDNYSLNESVELIGQTAPNSRVEVYLSSPNPAIHIADADKFGLWDFKIASLDIGKGDHKAKAKASSQDGLMSIYSQNVDFAVAEKAAAAGACTGADLNQDGRIDLTDLSIMMFWWNKKSDCVDINLDGIVDLTDLSIMMYWWTG